MMTLKLTNAQRAMATEAIRSRGRLSAIVREQIALGDLPDCLLVAYDGVSHRAFERFVARGSHPGNELADWHAAENELFLPVDIEFQDTEKSLYALATIEGLRGSEIAVAIEDRWLLISGYLESRMEELADRPGQKRQKSSCAGLEWIEFDELHYILTESQDDRNERTCSSSEGQFAEPPPSTVTARPFCVVELPVAVDPARSSAVYSDGLIAIRMPKMPRELRQDQ